MRQRIALSVLALVVVLSAAAVLWRLQPGGAAPDPGAASKPDAGSAARERAAELAAPAADAPAPLVARTALAGEPAPAEAARVAPRSAATRGPRISGRVLAPDGAALAGARVLASNAGGFALDAEPKSSGARAWRARFETTTDEEGRFVLDGPRPGNLSLAVRAAGFAPFDDDAIALPAGAAHTLPDVVLALGTSLAGRVVDDAGRGVAGARLLRVGPQEPGFAFLARDVSDGALVATTDATGRFRVDVLASAVWRLRVETQDHPTRTFQGLAKQPGERVEDLVLALAPGASVAGVVAGVPEGERGRVRVRASSGGDVERSAWAPLAADAGRVAEVGSDGGFELRGLDVDAQYVLRAEPVEPALDWIFGSARSDAVRVRAGERGVVLRYQEESTLVAQVVDGATGRALSAFRVEAGMRWKQPLLGTDGRPVELHEEGRVRVGGLWQSAADDLAELRIRATGYRDFERSDIRVAAGGVVDLGVIRLTAIPVVSVTVRAPGAQPIAGARVELIAHQSNRPALAELGYVAPDNGASFAFDGEPAVAYTDESGRAVLSSLEGQRCLIRASHADWAPAALQDVVLPLGEPVELELELARGGWVVVHARDSAGAPLAGATIAHRPPAELRAAWRADGPAHVTDADGFVRIERLTPGAHAFRLESDTPAQRQLVFGNQRDLDPAWSEVDVVADVEVALELRSRAGATLAGRITELDVPLAGAALFLRTRREALEQGLASFAALMGGAERRGRVAGDGRYRFEDVEPGRFVLTIAHQRRRMPAEHEVLLAAGANTLDVDLQVSVIEGRVSDGDGRPIAGVLVSVERADGPSDARARLRAQLGLAFAGRTGSVVPIGDDELGEQVRSDDDGRYSLRGVLSNVELVVCCRGERVQPGWSAPVIVAPGEVRTRVDLVLAAGGAIALEVLSAAGEPAAMCSVNAVPESGGDTVFKLALTGSTTLDGLRPGSWKVAVRGAGPTATGDSVERVIEVRAGETATAVFELP